MPFLFNEDDALFQLLSDMTVSDGLSPIQADAWGTRTVGVFFDMPDKELREAAYPFVTLDFAGIREATERTHRGIIYHESGEIMPEGRTVINDPGPGNFYSEEWPTPVDIIYQVSTFARTPQHDRQIMGQILYERIPFHFGVAQTFNDNRIRRLWLQDVRHMDRIESSKRLYRKVYTVVMSSEIPNSLLQGALAATHITLTVSDVAGTLDYGGTQFNTWLTDEQNGVWANSLSQTWENDVIDETF